MSVFYKYEYTRIMKNIHPCSPGQASSAQLKGKGKSCFCDHDIWTSHPAACARELSEAKECRGGTADAGHGQAHDGEGGELCQEGAQDLGTGSCSHQTGYQCGQQWLVLIGNDCGHPEFIGFFSIWDEHFLNAVLITWTEHIYAMIFDIYQSS